MNTTTADIEKLLQDEIIIDLPKTNLEAFLYFDEQLKTNVELLKKLVRIILNWYKILCFINYYLIFQKYYMVYNIKSTTKVSEIFTALIPRIITKDVQLLYTAFGKETNGAKKLNFSGTETYKYLLGIYTFFKRNSVVLIFKTYIYILILDVVTTKLTNISSKEISSQLSRWFSGAKDREGGKRERLNNNKHSSETRENNY